MPSETSYQKLTRRGAIAAGVGAVTAGCTEILDSNGSITGRPALSDRTLRYGSAMAVSGALGALGEPIADAAELPIVELNDSDLGVDIDHQLVDTETNQSVGIAVMQSLIDDGYPAIVGPLSSDVVIVGTQMVSIPEEVVTCSPSGTSPTLSIINDQGFSFRTAPDDSLQGLVAAQLGEDEHDAETAVVLHEASNYGRQLAGSFATSFNGETLAQVAFDPSGPYSPPVDSALSEEPDLLYLVAFPETGIELLDAYYTHDSAVDTILVSDGLRDPSLVDSVDELTENVFGVAPLAEGSGFDTFTEMYQSEFGREPGIFNAEAYDSAAVLLLANAAAGENNGPAIRDHIRPVTSGGGEVIQPGELATGIEKAAAGEDIEYQGASGSIQFDERGDVRDVEYEHFQLSQEGIVTHGTETP